MRNTLLIVLATAAFVAPAAVSPLLGSAVTSAVTATTAHAATDAATAEIARIRAHLTAVEAELRAADVSALSATQRTARARHIEVLREYREAGVFPHNHVLPDVRTPVFVDEHGTHCAVGYLLARDGRHELVAGVRAARNTATVHELADEPELVAWLEGAGLTLDEAARIQPMYGYEPAPDQVDRSNASYATATAVGSAIGGGVIVWNLLVGDDDARTLPGFVGIGVGLAELGLAAVAMDEGSGDHDIDGTHIALNAGIGVVSSLLGVRTLLTGRRSADRQAVGSNSGTRQQLDWQLSPWVPVRDRGVGMRVDLQF